MFVCSKNGTNVALNSRSEYIKDKIIEKVIQICINKCIGIAWERYGEMRVPAAERVRRRGASHLIISKLVTAPHTFMQKRPSSVACAP